MKNINSKHSNNTKRKDPDLKKSSVNIFLNIIIFLLAALIILMSWSLFHKLRENSDPSVLVTPSQVPAEIIQVEVLNGCGISGLGERFTDYLRKRNFDVVKTGNYISFDIDETMVIDRIGNIANANKVGQSLGVKADKVFSHLNDDYFLDVTVVIGRDYHKLNPVKPR